MTLGRLESRFNLSTEDFPEIAEKIKSKKREER